MMRIAANSSVLVPAATVGCAAVAVVLWLASHIVDIERGNAQRDAERAATQKTVDEMRPALEAIPRIQADVEWIRATMARQSADVAPPHDQAKR